MKKLIELLSFEDGTEIMIDKCLKVVSESNGVVIFGAGVGGQDLYNLLVENSMQDKVIAFSDNNELKFGSTYMRDDLYIIPPKQLRNYVGNDCIFIIASSAYDKIMRQLVDYGYEKEKIFLFNFAFMDLKYTDKEFIYDHLDDFQRAYERMNDAKSREIFVDILNYKITKDEKKLYEMYPQVDDEERQYFASDLFDFLPTERFLDVGAYTGDTLMRYDTVYDGNWNAYYGLEADKKVYIELDNVIKENDLENKTKIFNIAAWDNKTVLYFEENAGSSSMR